MTIKIEKKECDESWIVKPVPGYVCKWKDVKIGGAVEEENRKCFVNVCHCEQIPPPISDLDEEALAAKLDVGDNSYRIPICVGEIHCVRDRKNENSIKIDVLVNSSFYSYRLRTSDSTFFRHFLALVFCDLIRSKHCIELDPMQSIILKNRAVVGDLEAFKLKKIPEQRVVEEIDRKVNEEEIFEKPSIATSTIQKSEKTVENDISEECKSIYGIRNIDGLRVRCFDGKRLEISMSCESVTPPIGNPNRLRLKMTPTRVLVLLDNTKSLYDFSVPFNIVPKTAKSKYQFEKKSLVASVDIAFLR